MIGTFFLPILLPGVALQNGSPFLLTVEGESVIKNLVLISAGTVIAGMVEVGEG